MTRIFTAKGQLSDKPNVGKNNHQEPQPQIKQTNPVLTPKPVFPLLQLPIFHLPPGVSSSYRNHFQHQHICFSCFFSNLVLMSLTKDWLYSLQHTNRKCFWTFVPSTGQFLMLTELSTEYLLTCLRLVLNPGPCSC